MKASWLRDSYKALIRGMAGIVGLYRVLALIAALFIPLFRSMLPENAVDPDWQRYLLSGYFLLVLAASYLSKGLQKQMHHLAHFTMYVLVAWAGQLVILNDFNREYLVLYFIILTFSGVSFNSFRSSIIFGLTNFAMSLVAIIFFGQSVTLALMVLAVMAAMVVMMDYRLDIQLELNRQKDLMGSIYQDSPDAIFLANPHSFRIANWNQKAIGIFKAEAQSDHLSRWFSDWLKEFMRVHTFGEDGSIKTEVELPDLAGGHFWAEILVAEVEVVGKKRLLIRISDTTDKKLVEKSLRLSDYILQKVDQLVFVANEKAEVLYVSPFFETLLGMDPAEQMGNGWWETRQKQGVEVAEHKNYIIDCIAGKRKANPSAYEQMLIHRDGSEVWVSWREAVTSDNLMIAVATPANQERRNRLVQSVIFNIAEASSQAGTPFDFYRNIHQEIRNVINTPNFYIAVYKKEENVVYFPYYTDVENQVASQRLGRKRKAGRGLTEYAIDKQKPLLLSKQEILELGQAGHFETDGQAIPESWLGIPMVHKGSVAGLITIQDYQVPNAFSRDDLNLVSFIANQVAQFVHKLQADEALRVSEQQFRALYDQAPVGIARISQEVGFTQVNHRMMEIFGYDEEQLLKLTPESIAHPQDRKKGNEELTRLFSGEIDSYTTEKRYIHQNGSTIHATVSVSAYRVDDELKFIIAVYEDITDKKRAEQETQLLLTLSTELQNSLSAQDALNLGMVNLAIHTEWDYGEIWWADLNGQLRYCDCYYIASGDLKEFHTASKEMVTGKPPDYAHEWVNSGVQIDLHDNLADVDSFGRRDLALKFGFTNMAFIALKENEQKLGVMVLMRKKQSTVKENDMRIFRAAGSQLISVIQRKLAETAQRESEARFRAITEAAFEGIAIHRNGKILDVNSAFARLFGYDATEILDLSLADLLYEESPDSWLHRVTDESGESVEFTGRKANGEAIFMEAVSRREIWLGDPANILAVRDITGQKLVEEAREAARIDARFRAYVQNSSEIIQILDQDGRISYCSPSMERISGYSAEEMMGKHYLDLCHEADKPNLAMVQSQVAKTAGETGKARARLKHASGEWREIQTSMVNLMDDPLVRGVLFSSRDITDVISAQKSMTESEDRFRTLFALSPDAIFVESRAGYILDVNEAGCALHGLSRDEILGKHVTELSPEANREKVMQSFEKLFTSDFESVEAVSVNRSGVSIPVEVRVNVIQFQNEEAIIMQARDITERKASELVLKESEERFRALVEHATEAIFVLDLDSDTFIEVNKNTENLFGRSRNALMSVPPWELSPERQPDGSLSRDLQRQYEERAAKGEQLVYEWVHLHSSGKEIPCEVRLNRFPSSTNVLVRGSVTDITDRKLAEQRILQSQERLRVQNEMLIELAASPAINTGDLDRAYLEITRGMCDTMRVQQAGIWLFDEQRENLVCQIQYNARRQDFEQGQSIPVSNLSRYLQAIRDERVIAATDVHGDARVREFAPLFFVPEEIAAVIDAPFRHHGNIAGVVRTSTNEPKTEWSQESQNFAASMADMVALALEAWERKKTEEELAKTFSKMRATFDSTRDGILVVDNDGYVLEYNEGFVELSTVPQETLDSGVPNPGFATMVENVVEKEAFLEVMKRMEENPGNNERHIYALRDGRVIEIYVRPMVVHDESQGRLWFLHDITELKRAETALLESETKFRSLFSQANDAILVMEGDLISDYNDKALEMFGFTENEIKGKAFYELSPAKQPDGAASDVALWEYLDQVLKGESVSFNWNHQRADGVLFDAEVSLNQVRIGNKNYVQAFVRDITERVRAEYALRESERKNKAILDAIPDLMLRISDQGQILDYKTSDQQSLLEASQNLFDKHLEDVLPDAMVVKALEHMKIALETGEGQQYESEMTDGDETKDYETRLVRSGPREALIIIRDVTERKRTEKELIKRNFELDSFVYRASHDLKAPLNSLMGLIDLVADETADAAVLNYLGLMNKSVVKLDTFIRDLADFSRNARQELQTTVIDWQGMVNESLENLQFMEHAGRVSHQTDLRPSPPFHSDPVRIGIVLNNLISNAVKYQDLNRDDAFVRIEIENTEEEAIIRIIDNGIGIPEKYQEKVFNLFFRASIQSYGSGMGMYIVKNAVEKLRGTISLESAEGQGSTFTVVLPNNPAEQGEL